MKLESIEELRVFAQIVESGSLTAAGRVLGMGTNTVSRRLASLEERLGTTLLNRTTRSVSLSESGRTLLARARVLLEEVEATEVALQRGREGLAGVVRVGVPSVLAEDLLRALTPLLKENPSLRLQLAIHDRPVNPVTEGLDVAVIGGRLADSNLIAKRLTQVRLILVASRAYLAAYPPVRSPEDLAGHSTVHFRTEPPQATWVLTDARGEETVVAVTPRVEVDDGRALTDAMRAGLGIGATSSRVLLGHPDLASVLPGFTAAVFPIYAVYATSGQRSARLRALVQALETSLGPPQSE